MQIICYDMDENQIIKLVSSRRITTVLVYSKYIGYCETVLLWCFARIVFAIGTAWPFMHPNLQNVTIGGFQ
jgi:hypothetical protein